MNPTSSHVHILDRLIATDHNKYVLQMDLQDYYPGHTKEEALEIASRPFPKFDPYVRGRMLFIPVMRYGIRNRDGRIYPKKKIPYNVLSAQERKRIGIDDTKTNAVFCLCGPSVLPVRINGNLVCPCY